VTENQAEEMTPEVLRDLISLVSEVMIPAGVIASWTAQEQEWAGEWAAAEHLNASDSTGIRRQPKPACVSLAEELTANPAMAQLAVENWSIYMTQLQGSQRHIPYGESASLDAARRAITGLLVLLGDERPATWQAKAKTILGAHPEGVTPADLMALLGRTGPARDELHQWLEDGWSNGTLGHPRGGTWALKR
jgi:hypothetical protein